MKKSLNSVLTMVIIVSLISGIGEQIVFADNGDSVSQNSVSDNTASSVTEILVEHDEDGNILSTEVNEKKVTQLGHSGYRNLVARQQAENPDYITLTIPNTDTWSFEQTFAREELFNEFQKARMNPFNWWYYTNDLGDALVTETVTVTKEYVWDYNLEEAAMQRAIEQAYAYGHVRPNNVTSYEVYQDLNSPYWYSQNVNELTSAYGTTAKEIVDIYMEENDLCYAGQTHRIAILTDSYYRIGIGCVKTKGGVYYTAIEIAEDVDEDGTFIPLGEYTDPIDGYKDTVIEVAAGPGIAGFEISEQNLMGERIKLEVGETYSVTDKYFGPNVNGIITVRGDSVYFENWYSQNESVANIKNGIITATGEGVASIVATGKYIDAVVVVEVTTPEKQEQEPTPTTPPSDNNTGDTGNTGTQPTVPPATENTGDTGNNTTTTQKLKKQKITVAKKFRKTLVVKKSTLKKKSKTYKLGVVVNDGGSHGKVIYKVTKYPKGGKKYIKVSSKGKVTLKKGAKKGTYKIKITAKKAGNYKETSKTVTIKVK